MEGSLLFKLPLPVYLLHTNFEILIKSPGSHVILLIHTKKSTIHFISLEITIVADVFTHVLTDNFL